MYFNPYFNSPFFSHSYRRYVPNPLFPYKKNTLPSLASKNLPESNIFKKVHKNYENTNEFLQSTSKTSFENTFSIPSSENSTIQEKKEENRATSESPIFEFFGIKLYFDDILILCLLFFLYSEDVTDNELFLALILLLFS